MYRKILSVFRARAIKAGVVSGCCIGAVLYGLQSQVYADPATGVAAETATVAAAKKTDSGDNSPLHPVSEKKNKAAKPLKVKVPGKSVKAPDKTRPRVEDDARQTFVNGASAIGGFVDRRLSRFSIPGVSFKKLLVLTVSVILILVTISYYRTRRDRDRFMTTTRLSIMDKEVQRACRFIEEHFFEPELDLQKICDALVTGGAFLEALFIKELGLSIGDFIAQVRINRAKIALRKDPGIQVADLAHAVGFSSDGAFTEKFAAVAGVDLVTYREALGKSGDAAE